MGRSSRLFEIIQMLRQASGPVSARAMANALEVSQRTVYRDVVALQAMRVPIEGEAGVGYVMQAGFDLPPLMFTAEEIEAIAVGLSLIGRTGDAALLAAASRVNQKIAAVIPGAIDIHPNGLGLHVSHWNAIPRAFVDYHVMRQAIREERKLRLSYTDAGGRGSERTVRPIALVYYVDSVLLAAWCELREDFRHFRVDRITSCGPVESVFKGEGKALRSRWHAQHELFSAV